MNKINISKQELLIVSDKSFFIMSIKLNRKYDFFGQKNNCGYNYPNKGFINISTTTMDFTKLQEAATISKEALAKKTAETQKTLEQSFVDAMKSWEDAVKAKESEASTDTTKSSEALQVRSNFDTFKNNLDTEVRNLLNQEQAEKKEVEQQTKTETEKLLESITQDSVAIISATNELYKDKTRTDMVHMENLPTYINAFQTIIIQLGASTGLDDKSIDRLGPITRAGVKTIQQYLNDTYQAGLDIDGVPGPKTLEQLLAPVSSTDSTTRLEKMLSDKPTLTIFSVEVVNTTKTNKKTNTSGDKGGTKQENEVVTIEDANKEIPEKIIDAKLKELKKLYPKLDNKFLKAWAKAIINLKASTTLGEFIYDNKTYYFDSDRSVSRTKSKIDKKSEEKKEVITQATQEIINKYNLKSEYKNKDGKTLCYKKTGENGIYIIGKNNSLHNLTEGFGQDKWIVRYDYKYDGIQEWKNKLQPIWEDSINQILIETEHNPVVYAKLIEMCTAGAGTYDQQLSLILKNITQQKNFIQITNVYKALGFNLNGKNNLLDMLLSETSNGNGYDVYFIKFFEGLLKNNSDYIKDLIIKKGKTFSQEIFNNTLFIQRRKENNIEWNWKEGRHKTNNNNNQTNKTVSEKNTTTNGQNTTTKKSTGNNYNE